MQVHVESADVCRWIDGAFPGPALVPADPALQREMEALISGPCSGAVSAGLDLCAGKCMCGRHGCGAGRCDLCLLLLPCLDDHRPACLENRQPSTHTPAGRGRHWGIGSGQTAAQRAALEAQLGQLAAALQVHGGPYLLGADVSLADILVWPFLKRFSVAAPLTGYEVEANVHIQRWLAAMDARPSCATSAADPQLLLDAFRKHRSLDFFDFETFGAFELHPHNAHLLQQ